MSATKLNGHDRLPRGAILDARGEPVNWRHITAQGALPLTAQGPMAYPFSLGGSTGYGRGAANLTKTSLQGWLWHGGDADRDIGFSAQILRERSRDCFMGIPLARAAVETLSTNVIGEGLFPAPNVDGKALGLSDEQTAELNEELSDKFDWWASDARECDFEAKHNFYMLQHVAFQSMLLSGDCPVLFPLKARPHTLFEFRLRILEADRIRNPTFVAVTPDLNIFTGVELDKFGELIAYHIAEHHPLASFLTSGIMAGDMMTGKTFRVEPFGKKSGRRNMVLIIPPERPEQRRGVPILSVCIETLKQMGRYIDATVIGAVIQSYFTAFITSEFPDPTMFEGLLTEEQRKEIFNLNPYNVQLGPGVVNFMRPGHEVKFSSPTQPQSTFGEFTIAVAKFVGAALGIPYEVLLKQYNASYSASRAALLDFWKRVRKHRALMIDQFCQPCYEEWLADAISLGRIENFPGGFDDPYIRRAILRCNWTGASAGSLDPVKEVEAADKRVVCGFSTIERETTELNGSNYHDNIRQQSLEQDEFDNAGLIFPPYRPERGVFPEPAPAEPKPPPGTPHPEEQPGETQTSRVPVAIARKRIRRNKLHTAVELASGLSGRFER